MTNIQIIAMNKIELVENGVLADFDIDIHTFNGWKKLGYTVKKGEKSFIKFPIWKYVNSKKKTQQEEPEEDITQQETEHSKMIMKTASWFTEDQVQKIKA